MSLALQRLQFNYPDQGFALSVPEIVIQPGESIALVGPSGSGKTTLLNLIAGILVPGQGNITLHDVTLSELDAQQRRQHRLRHIGMIFQSFELLDYLDVRDNVLLQARLCREIIIDQTLEERAHAIASDLGLSDKWRRNVQALSQGERQRVAVCRALLLDPALVLADEPTGNLDPDNKVAALSKLIEECRQQQRILLTVTHDHTLLSHFDRVIDIATLLEQRGSVP
jgi:putative ABC transport system ATP-binding protein